MKILYAIFLSVAVLVSAAFAQSPATNAPAKSPALIPAMRSTPTNWVARHEGFVEIAKKGGVDLLFLGDSITDGWRGKGSNVWNKYYGSRNAANFGIGGDRTQHVLWRIENGELEGIKPKVVVLMIGTNNSQDDGPDAIAEAIKVIVGRIHDKIPTTKIVLLAVFPRNKPNDEPVRMETIKKVNTEIAKLDDGGKTVKYLDINAKFLGADGKVPAEIMPDFLHPNEKGYGIWAEAMEPTLAKMLK